MAKLKKLRADSERHTITKIKDWIKENNSGFSMLECFLILLMIIIGLSFLTYYFDMKSRFFNWMNLGINWIRRRRIPHSHGQRESPESPEQRESPKSPGPLRELPESRVAVSGTKTELPKTSGIALHSESNSPKS